MEESRLLLVVVNNQKVSEVGEGFIDVDITVADAGIEDAVYNALRVTRVNEGAGQHLKVVKRLESSDKNHTICENKGVLNIGDGYRMLERNHGGRFVQHVDHDHLVVQRQRFSLNLLEVVFGRVAEIDTSLGDRTIRSHP